MIHDSLRSELTADDVRKGMEELEQSAKWLAQSRSFIPTLQYVFDRYVKEHGTKCKSDLAKELNIDVRQIDHYIHGDSKIPKASKANVYKALIAICIVLDLEVMESFKLMACCGEPYLSFPADTSKGQHYAILLHPHAHTLLEWNQILHESGYDTLDYQKPKKPLRN